VAESLQRLKQTLKAQHQALEELECALEGTSARTDLLPNSVRLAVRNLEEEIRIARIVEESVVDLERLAGKKGLKVNLGCSSDLRPGFVNIDLEPLGKGVDPDRHPNTMFLSFDLRLGLPLEERSCDFIYSSHFFEHLPYEQAVHLMRDCYKALRFGGIFRMVLPDLKLDFDAYLRGDDEALGAYDPLDLGDPQLLSVAESGTMTSVDWVNYSVYQSGEHKYIYDEEKASLLLRRSGFRSVATSSYQEGVDIDEPIRRDYSFYIEAIKARRLVLPKV
jgi:predicted SAM-dependent methyltransferase